MNLILKLEAQGGAVVRPAVDDAIAIASKLDCHVEFDFNGHRFFLSSCSDTTQELNRFWKDRRG